MKKSSDIKERILAHIDHLGISKRAFYRETGISNGTLDKEGGLSAKALEKYLSTYPSINPDWVLTGKGNMLRDEVEHEVGNEDVHFSKENVRVDIQEPDSQYGKEIKADVTIDPKTGEMVIRVPGLVKRISSLESQLSKVMSEMQRLKGENDG